MEDVLSFNCFHVNSFKLIFGVFFAFKHALKTFLLSRGSLWLMMRTQEGPNSDDPPPRSLRGR